MTYSSLHDKWYAYDLLQVIYMSFIGKYTYFITHSQTHVMTCFYISHPT